MFSSPDDQAGDAIAPGATADPNDFVATAATELDGTSGTATYGAPYTHTAGAAQAIGPVSLQHIAGVTQPINTASDFVIAPSGRYRERTLTSALTAWSSATASQRQAWAAAYDAALQKAPANDPAKVAPGDYGPVPVMLGSLLSLAESGGLDGDLLLHGGFFQTDYTQPLLFIADGAYLETWPTPNTSAASSGG